MKLFCFGFGYCAAALAAELRARPGTVVTGTRTKAGPATVAFTGAARNPDVVAALAATTHVLVSIPPTSEGCPALRWFAPDLAALPALRWVGYLSTIGVYGDAGGSWVDETTPINPTSDRAIRRAAAEAAWTAFGTETGKRVERFRLPGIYGPGRSVLDSLRDGTAKRIIKPGQVFNRIHVDDIVGALVKAMAGPSPHRLYNVVDHEPTPPQDVVAFGATLLGIAPPSAIAIENAQLSPMGASFYAETKRVRNDRLVQDLGYVLRHPTYREGLRAILGGGI